MALCAMMSSLHRVQGCYATHPEQPGNGVCPSGHTVAYHEQFSLVGPAKNKAWMCLTQKAVSATTGFIYHAESAFLRAHQDGVEASFVRNSGRLEYGVGTVTTESEDEIVLVLHSQQFHNDHRGVLATKRVFRFTKSNEIWQCDKQLFLATASVWNELQPHMAATLVWQNCAVL